MRKGDFFLIALILIGTAALAFGFSARKPASMACILLEGQSCRELALEAASPEIFSFSSGGHHFTCEVAPGRIRVLSADCPDQICVATGWLDAPGKVIACVPGGVLITWQGTQSTSEVDVMLR